MSLHDDRFDDDASAFTKAARDEAEMQVTQEAELRDEARRFGRMLANELAQISLLNRKDTILGSATHEIAEGAAEEMEALFDRLLDKRALKEAGQISNG